MGLKRPFFKIMYKSVNKFIKLCCYSLISLNLSVNFHYLASALSLDYLKLLVYGALIVFGIFLIVFDDKFSQYLEIKENGILAIILIFLFCFFLGGCYRAITLNESIEAILLFLIPALLALTLLTIYLKILANTFSNRENNV
jgi:4-amino-4-deoxy-L-arabinose transferase-like glycosyltransferase